MVDFQSRNGRRATTGSDGPTREDSADEDPADEGLADEDATDPDASAAAGEDAALERDAVAVVAVSDEPAGGPDPAADAVAEALESADHEVRARERLRPSHDAVQETVDDLVSRDAVTAVVTTGGTGVAPTDVTVDAVRPLIDKELPGFGEAFRRQYADAVGTDAVATRATAGVAGATPIFCLPGDPEAARIGTGDVVVEQAARLSRTAADDA